MNQIIYDYIHMTQMEFLIQHPFVNCLVLGVVYGVWELISFIQKKKKEKKNGKQK